MKNILITGTTGYISTALTTHMNALSRQYNVSQISVRDENWRKIDFSGFDVIVHAAGLAHVRENSQNASLYYQINRDLTIDIAEKARAEGVSQFIFLSTASVYGLNEGIITKNTAPHPRSHYGRSKFEAELSLKELHRDNFRVAIIRPPMVYGDGCKGNYKTLIKIARVAPCFASYENKRSMIHIDRLISFIDQIIKHEYCGVYFPQDENYGCTCKMIQQIAAQQGKQIHLTPLLNPFVWLIKCCSTMGKKAFGTLIYQDTDACIESF